MIRSQEHRAEPHIPAPTAREVPVLAHQSEFWAYCPPCQRSFYVAGASTRERPSDVSCPMCLSPTPHVNEHAVS